MFGSGFQSPYIRPWTLSESPLFLLLVCLPACLLVLGIPLRPLWKLNPFFYFSKYYNLLLAPRTIKSLSIYFCLDRRGGCGGLYHHHHHHLSHVEQCRPQEPRRRIPKTSANYIRIVLCQAVVGIRTALCLADPRNPREVRETKITFRITKYAQGRGPRRKKEKEKASSFT